MNYSRDTSTCQLLVAQSGGSAMLSLEYGEV